MSLKQLLDYWFMSALQDFLNEQDLKIPQSLTYFPDYEDIRARLTKAPNPLDCLAVMIYGRKTQKLHRAGEWELVREYGEYQYFHFSDIMIPVEMTLFTVDELKAMRYQDLIEDFYAANRLIAMQGEAPAVMPDYFQQTLSYVYYDPLKWNGFRIDNFDIELIDHEGELYEIAITFEINLIKMLVNRYPAVEKIVINSGIGGFNTGTVLPLNLGLNSGSSGTGSGSNPAIYGSSNTYGAFDVNIGFNANTN